MSKARTYGRSLAANWIGYAANMLVLLFLTPFVVGSLGKSAYGVWSLLVSLTGHLGLAEIGVRVSTGRYINYYIGRKEPEKVSHVVSTSLAFYAVAGAVIVGIGCGLALLFGKIFVKVSPELIPSARLVVLLVSASATLGLFSSTFAQLLVSADRFDLRNAAALATLAVRTGGTVCVLSAGLGLVELAAVQVVSEALGVLLLWALSRRWGTPWHFARRFVRLETLRELMSFGKWAFVANSGFRIIGYTDAAVIGVLIGEEEIAVYSLGLMLVLHGRELVAWMFRVVTPDIEKAGGAQDLAALRWMVVQSTRALMFLAAPLFVGIMVISDMFYELWVGPQYVQAAAIGAILAMAHAVGMAARPSSMALSALGHIRFVSLCSLAEAVLNLGLSVLLVMVFRLGIYGVALGTLLPKLAVTGVLFPAVACRRLRLSPRRFLTDVTLRWVLAAGAFAGVCVLARGIDLGMSWGAFLLKVVGLLAAYAPLGFWVALRGQERSRIASAVGRPLARLARRLLGRSP